MDMHVVERGVAVASSVRESSLLREVRTVFLAEPSQNELRDAAETSFRKLGEELIGFASNLPSGLFDALPLIQMATSGVVVCGVGKSGIVAGKTAATLRSTGTPAHFLHAGEAAHGDIGMLQPGNCVILVSWSGETRELVDILPTIRARHCPVIAITGQPLSTIAKSADVVIDCSLRNGNHGGWLVPTTSTGVLMAMGDALAQMLRVSGQVSMSDIARLHPGGNIGDRLTQTVAERMHSGDLPTCRLEQVFAEVSAEMSRGGLGAVMIMEGSKMLGIITDGDVRRAVQQGDSPLTARDFMTHSPATIGPDDLMMVALDRMHELRITVMVVVDDEGLVVGMLSIHD
jgi:arabinose-5-phosphate isomerase